MRYFQLIQEICYQSLYCSPLSWSSVVAVACLLFRYMLYNTWWQICLKEENFIEKFTPCCDLSLSADYTFSWTYRNTCVRGEVNIMSVHSREMISCPPEYFFLWTILHKMCYTLFLFVLISIYSSLHNFILFSSFSRCFLFNDISRQAGRQAQAKIL